MNINLNNYETFLLLYADNELSAAEKLLVEAFLQEHPYLQDELDFLRSLVLPAPESFVFDKTSLYRSNLMNENMQEAMLLHLDNELAPAAKKELLKKLDEDKKIQESWQQLQQTKLDAADTIAFPDKKILYRKERGRLVAFRTIRWAVAAALIGLGFFLGLLVQKQQDEIKTQTASQGAIDKKQRTADAGANKNVQSGIAAKAGNLKDVSGHIEQNGQDDEPGVNTRQENIAEVKNKKFPKSNLSLKSQPEDITAKKDRDIKLKQVPEQNEKATILASIDEKQKIKKPDDNVASNLTASINPKKRPDIVDSDETEMIRNSYAKMASLDDEQTNNNRILYMDEETVSHSKAGAFFKKLKRTVARSANIKTGSSLKIAGFDFSVK